MARRPAAISRRGACCAAIRGAPAGTIRCRRSRPRLFAVRSCVLPSRTSSSSERPLHERYSPHPAVGGVLDVARSVVGRLEQAQRQALAVQPGARLRRRPSQRRGRGQRRRPACRQRPARLRCRARWPARRPAPLPAAPVAASGAALPASEKLTITDRRLQVHARLERRRSGEGRTAQGGRPERPRPATSCCSTTRPSACTWRRPA